MNKDNNIPLCYQITVSNIIKIGDRVMSVIMQSSRIFMSYSNLHKKIKIHGSRLSFTANSQNKMLISLGISL